MANCPTCSQPIDKNASALVQARVATRISAERAARKTAQRVLYLQKKYNDWEPPNELAVRE